MPRKKKKVAKPGRPALEEGKASVRIGPFRVSESMEKTFRKCAELKDMTPAEFFRYQFERYLSIETVKKLTDRKD